MATPSDFTTEEVQSKDALLPSKERGAPTLPDRMASLMPKLCIAAAHQEPHRALNQATSDKEKAAIIEIYLMRVDRPVCVSQALKGEFAEQKNWQMEEIDEKVREPSEWMKEQDERMKEIAVKVRVLEQQMEELEEKEKRRSEKEKRQSEKMRALEQKRRALDQKMDEKMDMLSELMKEQDEQLRVLYEQVYSLRQKIHDAQQMQGGANAATMEEFDWVLVEDASLVIPVDL